VAIAQKSRRATLAAPLSQFGRPLSPMVNTLPSVLATVLAAGLGRIGAHIRDMPGTVLASLVQASQTLFW